MNNQNPKFCKLLRKGTLLCLFPIVFACDKEEIVDEYLSPVGVAKLPKELSLGQSLNVLVLHSGANSCAQYSRTETKQDGNEVEVIFYAKTVPPDGTCLFAIKRLETPFTFIPKKVGTYIFKFRQEWRSEPVKRYLTDTVIVK